MLSRVTYRAAHLNIQDVKVVIVFLAPAFEEKTAAERMAAYRVLAGAAGRAGLAGDAALVWLDRDERTRFIARPEQHPFFQITQYGQLLAQANASFTCEPAPAIPADAPPDPEPSRSGAPLLYVRD